MRCARIHTASLTLPRPQSLSIAGSALQSTPVPIIPLSRFSLVSLSRVLASSPLSLGKASGGARVRLISLSNFCEMSG